MTRLVALTPPWLTRSTGRTTAQWSSPSTTTSSLFHDHGPAKREGLPSVWINRRHDRPGWGATPEPTAEWAFDLEFTSMADFADAVDQAFTDA